MRRWLSNSLAFFGAFAAAVLLRLHTGYFDAPVATAVNRLAAGDSVFNRIAYSATLPVIQGVGILSLLWCCWFLSNRTEARMRLIRGTVAAILVALAAHFMHDHMDFSRRPIFEPALALQTPAVLGDADVLRATSNPPSPSFPSERAALFAGLAVAAFMACPPIGVIAVFFTLAVEACRIYLGMHYPSDIIGSASLAAACVWLSEAGSFVPFGSWLMKWERASRPSFYLFALLASYEIVMTFDDVRYLSAILPFR